MARKPPKILNHSKNSRTDKIDKVLECDGIWAVYYQNKPINIRSDSTQAFVPPKYKTTSFSNSGHAINLVKKLNKQFDTTDFTVVFFDNGKTIYSE